MTLCLIPSFSSEVYVKVDPAANVGVVQANITALLSLTFSDNLLTLTSDPDSISILPVGSYRLYHTATHKKRMCSTVRVTQS